jgi:hypothetical protein
VHSRLLLVAIITMSLSIVSLAHADCQNYMTAVSQSGYDVTATGFSVECWVKTGLFVVPSAEIVRCQRGTVTSCAGTGEMWELLLDGLLGKVTFTLQKAGSCHSVLSSVRIDDGLYHHVAGTYDGTTLKLYVDGALSASQADPGVFPVTVSGGGTLVVGEEFNGAIDEVRLWNVARSLSEIQINRNGEIANSPNLTGYWKLNGDGTDSSSGANSLVPIGIVSFQPGRLGLAAVIQMALECPSASGTGIMVLALALIGAGVVGVAKGRYRAS